MLLLVEREMMYLLSTAVLCPWYGPGGECCWRNALVHAISLSHYGPFLLYAHTLRDGIAYLLLHK